MLKGKSFLLMLLACVCLGPIQAETERTGDSATFQDLGFSQEGRYYNFAQYGVLTGTLRPWAELIVVDVTRNDYAPGGKFSSVGKESVRAGQDGSGTMRRLLNQNNRFRKRYGLDQTNPGQPLYISQDSEKTTDGRETIKFRDFNRKIDYQANLIPITYGKGGSLKSSFYIELTQTGKNGNHKTWRVGTPELKRPQIHSYHIEKVLENPEGNSLIFVIRMKQQSDPRADSYNIRYMVEALRLTRH
jgi:predicted secreted protein